MTHFRLRLATAGMTTLGCTVSVQLPSAIHWQVGDWVQGMGRLLCFW